MNDFEKRWQRISELLQLEITGEERPMVSSGRTLFGIKSDAQTKMDQFAKEIEEEYTAKRKAREAQEQDSANNAIQAENNTHSEGSSTDSTHPEAS